MVGLELEIIEPVDDEEPATEKQKNFIRVLIKEVGAGEFPEDTLNDLGKWQASAIIDQLQSFKAELQGSKPVDESRITGLSEGDYSQGSDKSDGFPVRVIIALAVVVLIAWLVLSKN